MGMYSYNWSSATGTGLVNGMQDQTGLSVGTYNVTVTDNGSGCSSFLSILLSVPEGCGGCDSVEVVTVTPDTVCSGHTATFTAVGTLPGATFAWFDENGMQVGTGPSFVSGPLTVNTTYCVEQTIIVPITLTYEYTGETSTFVVPAGVNSITITALGAQGGAGGGVGAPGGSSNGVLAVVPGQTLYIN